MRTRQFTIDEAIAYLEAHIDHAGWAARSGRTAPLELSLDRMRRLVHQLGDPQTSVPVVHVTGTNGKGSTSRMITRLLMAEGLRVGTYSSPHLARYNERFRIDDVDIADDVLAGLLAGVADAEDAIGERLMPFEALTAAAFCWFAREAVDVAVIEVGVLGRYDATNVADGRVAVITNIGFDHTNGEGDWSARIAAEKAGIVKPGAHVVIGAVEPRHRHCFEAESPSQVWALDAEVVLEENLAAPGGRKVSVRLPGQRLDHVHVPLRGQHQGVNAAVAIGAATAFLQRPLDAGRAAAGLADVEMPARFEVVRPAPAVVLDGAHNPDAVAALAASLAAESTSVGRRTLLIGLLAGRDPRAMLVGLGAADYDEVIACTAPTARGLAADDLAQVARSLGCDTRAIADVREALRVVLADAAADDRIVVTGSIYLVAEARSALVGASGDINGRSAYRRNSSP